MQCKKRFTNRNAKKQQEHANITNLRRPCNLTQQTIPENQTPLHSFHLKPGSTELGPCYLQCTRWLEGIEILRLSKPSGKITITTFSLRRMIREEIGHLELRSNFSKVTFHISLLLPIISNLGSSFLAINFGRFYYKMKVFLSPIKQLLYQETNQTWLLRSWWSLGVPHKDLCTNLQTVHVFTEKSLWDAG